MGCFEDGLKNICEPYGGNMPLFHSSDTTDASVTIVSESYDDGMRVTKIQTPPRTETRTLIEAIDAALGLVHNLDIGEMKTKDKDSDKDDGVQAKQKQDDEQGETDSDDDKSEKPRGFGQAMSEKRMASEDKE